MRIEKKEDAEKLFHRMRKPRWKRKVDRMATYEGAADRMGKSGKPRRYKGYAEAWELKDRILPLSWDPYED
jgi:hypothetical protein